MKNTIKIIVGYILCFVMINNVNASQIYGNAVSDASNYLNTNININKTYDRFLLPITSNKTSFYKGVGTEDFTYGGLLSYDEFKITKNGHSKNEYSYLYLSNEYWTYTANGNERYVVSSEIDDKKHKQTEKSGTRVTEIVKPAVTVIGEGTYSDPWIFEPQYNVTIYANKDTNGNYKGKLGFTTDKNTSNTKISITMSSNSSEKIYIYPESGYEYLGNTCGIIMNDVDIRNGVNPQYLTISSISRDIECTVNFGEKPYLVDLKPEESQYTEMTEVEPEKLYIIVNKSWYDEQTSTNAVSKLKKSPTLQGYTYEGYYDAKNYSSGRFQQTCSGNQIIGKDNKLASPTLTKIVNGKTVTVYSDNMQAYPCFKPIEYTIKYDCGTGTAIKTEPQKTTHVYNIEKQLLKSSEVCKKTGYTFAGWARDLEGTNPDRFLDNTTYEKITTTPGEMTLYAQWTANTYTITYHLGKGTTTASTTQIGTQTCVYDSNCTLKEFSTINSSYPFPHSYEYEQKDTSKNKNYGWSFYGWTTNKTEKPNAENKININYTDNKTFKYTTAGNINLYAIGQRNIHFNGGISPKQSYSEPVQYWNPYQANNTYLTSVAIPVSKEIETWTFKGYKCGSSVANSEVTIASTKAGTSQKLAYNIYPYTRSVYERTLTVAYDANGGTGTTQKQTSIQYYNSGYGKNNLNYDANETKVSFKLRSSGYTRSAYSFSNWTEGSKDGTGYNANATYEFPSTAGNKTITKTMYAKWTPLSYTITYTLNGGTNPTGAPTGYNVETTTFNLPTPSRSGYTFAGWYTSSSLTGTAVTQIAKGTTGNKKYYAKWTPITYTITYNLDGGTNPSGAKTNYNIETTTYTLPTPSKTGYTFAGWYTSSSLTGTAVTQIAKGTTGNKTFYAKWTLTNYTITYNLNGGTNPSGAKTSYNITTATYTLPTPSKPENTFLGWYTESSYTNKVTSITHGSTGNKTFYAKWQAPTTLPDFEYTGSYQLVKDDDTVITSGTNNRVTLPSSYQNYQGNWKLRLLTTGDLTFYSMPQGTSVDIFLVGSGGNGKKGNIEYGCYSANRFCCNGGSGGKGGECKTNSNITLTLSTKYTVTVGKSEGASKIAVGGTTYQAAGKAGAAGGAGIGGYSDDGSAGKSGCYEFGNSSYSKRYGGGGGGAAGSYSSDGRTGSGGAGGTGGGGRGGNSSYWSGYGSAGSNGSTNTGGGGGGGGTDQDAVYSAGKGGSGIVIIRNKR